MRNILITLFTCIAAMAFTGEISAQHTKNIDTVRTTLQVRRPALEPVPSLEQVKSGAIDTLDTVNEHVKVILYADTTWEYYTLTTFAQEKNLFGEYWDETKSNPYGIEQKDLPDQWSIWLVDSLDQYHYPFLGKVHVRGKFGMRRGRRHQGVDLPLKTGDPIYAAFTGKVRMSRYFGAFGNLVVIRHDNGIETFYAHLSQRNVEVGDWVNAGDVIGLGGSTGRSTGPHLHFETRYKGFAFDPQWLIDFETGTLRKRLFVLKKKFFNIYSNYEQDFEDEFKNAEEDKKEDAEREAMRWYTIKSGDTLGRIAINYGTTVNAICKLNGITPNTTLKIGRRIRVR